VKSCETLKSAVFFSFDESEMKRNDYIIILNKSSAVLMREKQITDQHQEIAGMYDRLIVHQNS
jgi:hypothetical protein